jgi:hypothetical protein
LHKKTKKAYEDYCNEIECPELDHPKNNGRVSWLMVNKYGTWLRKNDPVEFEIGYNEWEGWK